MENDDRQIGTILTRREALTLIGATGLTVLIGCTSNEADPTAVPTTVAEATAVPPTDVPTTTVPATDIPATAVPTEAAATATATQVVTVPSCVVRPEVTEGPYYVDVDLLRSDIREDKAGLPLVLTFNVVEVGESGCFPLENALVEIWHCDAEGVYSGVNDPGFNTSGQTWLRGAQMTDANGVATFTTIYPGWYSGRCIHIHFKVHPTEELVFTSQLFFPDAFNAQVMAREPYAAHGQPNTLDSTDGIYQDTLLLDPTTAGDGYAATFPIGIDLATVGTGQNGGGPGGGPGGGGPPPGGNV